MPARRSSPCARVQPNPNPVAAVPKPPCSAASNPFSAERNPLSQGAIRCPQSCKNHNSNLLRIQWNLTAARYSVPTNCRELVIPVRQAKGGKPICEMIGNRWPPPPAPAATIRPPSHHHARSRTSPAKSKLSTWQAPSRQNPALRKNQKNTLFRSDTTDPKRYRLCSNSDPASINFCCVAGTGTISTPSEAGGRA